MAPHLLLPFVALSFLLDSGAPSRKALAPGKAEWVTISYFAR